MVDAVIFDMDGLMFDTEPVWDVCLRKALVQMGLPVDESFINAIRGCAQDGFNTQACKAYGDTVDVQKMWDLRHELVTEEFRKHMVKKPGLDELLAYLVENNIPRAVASSSVKEHVELDLTTAGVKDKFSVIVSGQDIEHSKPEPDIFLLAASKLDSNPSNTLVLEDSYNGVRAGAAGGFITIMVPDMLEPTDEMRRLTNRICTSLTEVRDLLAAGEL